LAEEPVIVDMADRPWEAWPVELVEERGGISWKTLVSADQTRSETLTFGIARLPPRERLREHHHAQAELYFVLAGSGEVIIDGEVRSVGPGTCVFIPGQARHSCANSGHRELRFAYVLAADSFGDVDYIFEQ
jgi:mannose-6-phosphate isomerase-like protein (cupin superfamily)